MVCALILIEHNEGIKKLASLFNFSKSMYAFIGNFQDFFLGTHELPFGEVFSISALEIDSIEIDYLI